MSVMKLMVFVERVTNRINYIFDLLLHDLLGIDFELTTDADAFNLSQDPKLVYAKAPMGNALFQKASKLLLEYSIVEQNPVSVDYEDTKGIFPVYHSESIMPFDPFAASFYFVSRYEEYLSQVRDCYGRFQAESTCMYKMGMLQKPLVNIYAQHIGRILQDAYPSLKLAKRTFRFIPTYDIDAAWAYLHKGLFRTAGGFLKDLYHLNSKEISRRHRVLMHKEKDPFDTYDLQFALQKEYKLKPIYFILCGDYDMNDKNISIRNDAFCKLIKHLGDYAEVGIHPSFSSYLDTERIQMEIDRLSNVLNREITKSRQHFLRMTMPRSYQQLIELDITDDYTMGFPSQAGFRAGIADTFRFFDLENDVITNLNVHPFAIMDGTARDYLNLDIEATYSLVTSLIDEVRAVGGSFVLLCHNETLSGQKRWVGWPQLYKRIVEYTQDDQIPKA